MSTERDLDKTMTIESKASVRAGAMGDVDAKKLEEMGYEQAMERNFSVWNVLGVGFSLTNSWWAVSAAMSKYLPILCCMLHY